MPVTKLILTTRAVLSQKRYVPAISPNARNMIGAYSCARKRLTGSGKEYRRVLTDTICAAISGLVSEDTFTNDLLQMSSKRLAISLILANHSFLYRMAQAELISSPGTNLLSGEAEAIDAKVPFTPLALSARLALFLLDMKDNQIPSVVIRTSMIKKMLSLTDIMELSTKYSRGFSLALWAVVHSDPEYKLANTRQPAVKAAAPSKSSPVYKQGNLVVYRRTRRSKAKSDAITMALAAKFNIRPFTARHFAAHKDPENAVKTAIQKTSEIVAKYNLTFIEKLLIFSLYDDFEKRVQAGIFLSDKYGMTFNEALLYPSEESFIRLSNRMVTAAGGEAEQAAHKPRIFNRPHLRCLIADRKERISAMNFSLPKKRYIPRSTYKLLFMEASVRDDYMQFAYVLSKRLEGYIIEMDGSDKKLSDVIADIVLKEGPLMGRLLLSAFNGQQKLDRRIIRTPRPNFGTGKCFSYLLSIPFFRSLDEPFDSEKTRYDYTPNKEPSILDTLTRQEEESAHRENIQTIKNLFLASLSGTHKEHGLDVNKLIDVLMGEKSIELLADETKTPAEELEHQVRMAVLSLQNDSTLISQLTELGFLQET